MRVLAVGGSGYVGSLVLPIMADRFALRIFDRVPPPEESPSRAMCEYFQGDVTDPESLSLAAEGMDALLYMAMGKSGKRNVFDPAPAYDVNVKGLHLALEAAVQAGVRHAVYTSTLSVYEGHLDIRTDATDREDVLPQPRSNYGFTKWLGEEVCRYFHRKHGLPVLALRLYHPVSQQEWRARYRPDGWNAWTSAPDLARALIAALELDHDRFEIIHITGDTVGRAYHHEKAKRFLNWEPLERGSQLP